MQRNGEETLCQQNLACDRRRLDRWVGGAALSHASAKAREEIRNGSWLKSRERLISE